MVIVDRDGSISYQTQRAGRARPLMRISAVVRTTFLWIFAQGNRLLAIVNARQHIQSHMDVCAYHQPAYGC
jgi:hypothetical protein